MLTATIDTLTPVSHVQPDRTVVPLLLLGQIPGAEFIKTGTSPIELPATPVDTTNKLPPDIGVAASRVSKAFGAAAESVMQSTATGATFLISVTTSGFRHTKGARADGGLL